MTLSYSSRFNRYNANIRVDRKRKTRRIEFRLSAAFRQCEEDIIIGIIQHLLNRLYKTNIPSMEQEFYSSFIKHIPRYTKHGKSDPLLQELFEELNETYFRSILEPPAMRFGSPAATTLGHYNFTNDTITISSLLKPRRDLVRYVLYHELLHKKHSFKNTTSRTIYHTKSFRDDEKAYDDPDIEKKLETFLKKYRKKHVIKNLLDHW